MENWSSCVLILVVSGFAALLSEPCTDYSAINNTALVTTYQPTNITDISCPTFVPFKWYRYTGTDDGLLTNICPERFQCGSHSQIWINDTFPTVDEGERLTKVCIHMETSCCYSANMIKMKNCTDFMVYLFVPTPSCVNYCFDSPPDVDHTTVSGNVDRTTVSGDVEHTTVSGDVDHTTVSGDVDHTTVSGDVDRTTVSGDVDRTTVSGDVDQTTVSGDVDRTTVSGDVDQTTVSGDVDRTTVSGDVDQTTVSGDVDRTTVSGDVDRTTVSGDVDQTTVSGDVDRTTVSGDVDQTTVSGDVDRTTVSGDVDHTTVSGNVDHTTVSGNVDHTTVNGGVDQVTSGDGNDTGNSDRRSNWIVPVAVGVPAFIVAVIIAATILYKVHSLRKESKMGVQRYGHDVQFDKSDRVQKERFRLFNQTS